MNTASDEFTSPAFLTFSCEIKPVKPNRLKTGQKEKKKNQNLILSLALLNLPKYLCNAHDIVVRVAAKANRKLTIQTGNSDLQIVMP